MPAFVELTLDPEPASVGIARRAVARALRTQGAAEELVDTAALLVSEVVTNAVIHAGTIVRVRFETGRQGARVEVADGSSVAPSPRERSEHDSTGRGLFLVESLATESGVQDRAGGKVVWFVVGEHRGDAPEDSVEAGTYTVRFVDLHVPMARAALAYGEAVLRELALLAFGGASEPEERWQAPRFNLGPLLHALDRAADRGQTIVTIDVDFPLDAKDLSLERLALVEEGHQLAREGKLLTVAAIPEVMHCRRWIYRQIHQQADGAEPERWDVPDDDSDLWVTLDPGDISQLESAGPVVAADGNNRIVFVNAPAEQLLNADAVALVGRRLTTIVPADWRLAHLAGFARFQLTGSSRIIGSSVAVPVLRADGMTVDVLLHIEVLQVGGGRVFRATLEPSPGASVHRRAG